jgi:hypothetical protein
MNAYVAEGSAYLRLLHNVVRAARSAAFPSRGVFDMSNVRAALPSGADEAESEEETYRIRSASHIERDKQVGAAGELFVSVLLLKKEKKRKKRKKAANDRRSSKSSPNSSHPFLDSQEPTGKARSVTTSPLIQNIPISASG